MKFFVKKLGCPKNDVDGDFIAGRLIESGHYITEKDIEAEAVIVNTCGFILPAKEESIDEILHYEKLKNQGDIRRLYVTGCLSQRYGDELLEEVEGIDGVFGLGQIDELVWALSNGTGKRINAIKTSAANLKYLAAGTRYVEKTYPYEYLKISDGCDRYCGYCAIPYIRGRYRSRAIDEIIREAETLAAAGKKEIILVSQEGSGYGRDKHDGTNIIALLERLEKVEGVEWIRLMYLHPEAITDELITFMSSAEKTLGYFDVPLQHINDGVLARMNRHVTRGQIEGVLDRIRQVSRENIIRTTFIAGLPRETEEEFRELYDFVREFEFERLGVFKYSREEGTPAGRMEAQVDEKVKDERMDALMTLQQEIAFRKNIALIDSFQKVIIDRIAPDSLAVGRTRGDCPEIDQTVMIRNSHVRVGDIVDVRIIMTEGYDLIGTVETGSR